MRGAEKALWEGEELRDSGSWGAHMLHPSPAPLPFAHCQRGKLHKQAADPLQPGQQQNFLESASE